jgi:hypothetical protein
LSSKSAALDELVIREREV